MSADFYQKVAAASGINADSSVLVICGGSKDKNIMQSLGVKNCTISNLDYHAGHTDYAPYAWERQDAENLTAADDSFDWVIVHAGLHHCGSPHRGLCEMLRVARKGVLVVEARDSFMMRLNVRMGFTPDYELEAVLLAGGTASGYRNTQIPDYIYRWTEREVEKTVKSYLPQFTHTYNYYYGYLIPTQRLAMSKSIIRKFLAKFVEANVSILETLLPKQGNRFGFVVTKCDTVQPWLMETDDTLVFKMEYMKEVLDTSKYKS